MCRPLPRPLTAPTLTTLASSATLVSGAYKGGRSTSLVQTCDRLVCRLLRGRSLCANYACVRPAAQALHGSPTQVVCACSGALQAHVLRSCCPCCRQVHPGLRHLLERHQHRQPGLQPVQQERQQADPQAVLRHLGETDTSCASTCCLGLPWHCVVMHTLAPVRAQLRYAWGKAGRSFCMWP